MVVPLVAALIQLPPLTPFVAELRDAVTSGNSQRITHLFVRSGDSDYLFRMAAGRGGLRTLKVAVIPSPPGWEATGNYWAVIHTRQDIEEDHDPVYPVVVDNFRWKLGREIPEDATANAQISDAAIDVHLLPAASRIQIHTVLSVAVTASNRAPLYRLNDNFRLESAAANGAAPSHVLEAGDTLLSPKEGDVVHAGSLLIPWSRKVSAKPRFDYSGILNSSNEDKIDARVCYLTAWWVPSLGRLPFTTSTRVVGPAGWVIESEGNRVSPPESRVTPAFKPQSGEQERCFRCDIPISFPKVVAGAYIVASEKRAGGRTYRAYHLDSSDNARAEKDVQTIADAIAWYEQRLGPFPFNEYNCFDADTYYGIESYSYTLLNSRITAWAVGHEALHTYFGGLVPCAYVHDSWNESMTQYVDSVLRRNNSDRTLEGAAASINLRVPLTELPVAHEYASATYFRGAFALKMLENEIGIDAIYKALRAMIADRRGKETTWYDLRHYFEKASGRKLDWFWSQWISGATFPKLAIIDAQGTSLPPGTQVHVVVRQTGTPEPYRLRFRIYAKGIATQVSQVVTMNSPEAGYVLNLGPEKAYEAGIETLGYVLTPRVVPAKVKP